MTRKHYSAYESALESLARRSHSRKELKSKLFRKGFPGKDIYQALDRLEELGYLDDRKFATEYARYRLRQSPRGRMLLSAELIKRGVSRDIVDQILPEVFEEYPEDRLVEELVGKWRRTCGEAFATSDITKLVRSLSRKGFEWEVIRRQVGHLTPTDSGAFD